MVLMSPRVVPSAEALQVGVMVTAFGEKTNAWHCHATSLTQGTTLLMTSAERVGQRRKVLWHARPAVLMLQPAASFLSGVYLEGVICQARLL